MQECIILWLMDSLDDESLMNIYIEERWHRATEKKTTTNELTAKMACAMRRLFSYYKMRCGFNLETINNDKKNINK